MTAHLAEISAMVDPGAHAVVILDLDRPSKIMTIGLREWAHGF
jgi:hypothetical protein